MMVVSCSCCNDSKVGLITIVLVVAISCWVLLFCKQCGEGRGGCCNDVDGGCFCKDEDDCFGFADGEELMVV